MIGQQQERHERITELHEQGQSLRAIAREVGVSKSQVERDLRNGSAQPVAPPKPRRLQRVSDADETRLNLSERPAQLVAEHPRTYDFLHAFATVSHLDWVDGMRLLQGSDGTVADALVSDNSFIAREDAAAFIDEACQFWELGLQKVIRLREEDLARAQADLKSWQEFTDGGDNGLT